MDELDFQQVLHVLVHALMGIAVGAGRRQPSDLCPSFGTTTFLAIIVKGGIPMAKKDAAIQAMPISLLGNVFNIDIVDGSRLSCQRSAAVTLILNSIWRNGWKHMEKLISVQVHLQAIRE